MKDFQKWDCTNLGTLLIKVGMKHKHPHQTQLSSAEQRLIKHLREHPELMERFQTILEITANADGPVKRADKIEALLIEEMRQLGNATMESWASRAERTLGEQLKQKDPSAVVRKKTLTWWCVFGAVSVTERVWCTEQQNYLRLLPEAIGVSARGRFKRLERVLTDFGSEHSFRHAAARVLEHYGFEINASAVRNATLQHAHRAGQILQKEYEQPFRVLPAAGAPQVVA